MQIGSLNNAQAVKNQYASSTGLNTRINFHDKCSTNKLGYANWINSNYDFKDGIKALEIGCGTGCNWLGHEELIDKFSKIIFTDMSQGMLDTIKGNIGERENVEYQIQDIQNLSFEDNSFDVVIANSMLYHVPDLDKGLSEVRRVLKDGGVFYCATFGENNFQEKLAEWFELSGETFKPNHNFTMENGTAKLSKSFKEVSAVYYEDSLHITDINDLLDYLKSLKSLKMISDMPEEKVKGILNQHLINGALDLPKEYGMFICS